MASLKLKPVSIDTRIDENVRRHQRGLLWNEDSSMVRQGEPRPSAINRVLQVSNYDGHSAAVV